MDEMRSLIPEQKLQTTAKFDFDVEWCWVGHSLFSQRYRERACTENVQGNGGPGLSDQNSSDLASWVRPMDFRVRSLELSSKTVDIDILYFNGYKVYKAYLYVNEVSETILEVQNC